MMWILIQRNKANTKFKYLSSNDYLFITRDDIYFEIRLGEDLDYARKNIQKNKKKKFI